VREEVIAILLMRVYCNNVSKPNKIDDKEEEEEAVAGAHAKGFSCSNKGIYFILLKP
jgi:hypothetical protein